MSQVQPDALQGSSLDWAKAHISRFGDTDIFPRPFEFEAIWADWTTIRQRLQSQDLASVPPRPHRRLLVPKPRGGFRVAIQLDPLDALMYAALGYEVAPKLEAARIEPDKRIACSYRLAPAPTGELFIASADGWADFQTRSRELAKQATHVAIADISDFYNQIYHHRLHNALESALVVEPRPENVERFLGRITSRQSRGIPVGPATSIVFAEACLNDVDKLLVSKGFVHARYVDDFRVFCASERDAIRALHDLAEYLFTAHRLSLQASKTEILSVSEFRRKELNDPEHREERAKLKQTKLLIQEAIEAAGFYGEVEVDLDELVKEKEQVLARKALIETFKACVKTYPLHLGLARYLLRRASALRMRALSPHVLKHLPVLSPVIREVMQYLDKVWNGDMKQEVAAALPDYLNDKPHGWIPFVRDWILWLIAKRGVLTASQASKLAEACAATLGLRHRALVAAQFRQGDWVRERKETWMNAGPWDRRAVLWAGCALPRDERRAWLEPIEESDDAVDASIAKYVRSLA